MRAVRWMLRWSLRALLRVGPRSLRELILRLPFSRLGPRLPALLGGLERGSWRGVRLEFDPGEMEGFFRFFTPDGPDPEFDWLRAQCANATVFADIGANQGIYSLALTKAHPALTAVAFEPDPGIVARLRRNVELNAGLADRIVVVEAAVGAVSQRGEFLDAAGLNSGIGRLVSSHRGGRAVAVRALGDYVRATGLRPEVLKIDVEGGELDVLAGLGDAVAGIRAMAIELHAHAFTGADREAFKQRAIALLTSLPFQYRFLLDDREWREGLTAADEWPVRLHVFATRR